MPGLGVAHHQVARHVVAVHVHRGLREVACEDQRERALQQSRAAAGASVDAEVARDDTSPETDRARAAAGPASYGGSTPGRLASCHWISASIASREQPASALASSCSQRREIGRGAEIGEQQKAPAPGPARAPRGAFRPARAQQPGDVHERPAILVLRAARPSRSSVAPRRARKGHAEIAAEARVRRGGCEREPGIGIEAGEPALERSETLHRGRYDTRGQSRFAAPPRAPRSRESDACGIGFSPA